MTVPTISTLSSGSEGTAKLLNNSGNTKIPINGVSFNATMNETASNYKFDDQLYLLADGQVLSADQLLEMLDYPESGNPLPGVNLPTIPELQQYKLQSSFDRSQNPVNVTTKINSEILQFEPTNNVLNNKFSVIQQQFMNQALNQNQFVNSATTLAPQQFMISANAVNNSVVGTPETTTGFTAAYGYQLAGVPDSTLGLMSNSFSITTPVQHPQWNQSLGQSVQWMVNNNIQQAEIKLNPPDLGLLDIRITINNDQASVHFAAPNSAVRDALEAAMPRLRDMLEESGISLVDVNVSEHSLDQQATDENSEKLNDKDSVDSNNKDNNQSLETVNSSKTMSLGLLDTYA